MRADPAALSPPPGLGLVDYVKQDVRALKARPGLGDTAPAHGEPEPETSTAVGEDCSDHKRARVNPSSSVQAEAGSDTGEPT